MGNLSTVLKGLWSVKTPWVTRGPCCPKHKAQGLPSLCSEPPLADVTVLLPDATATEPSGTTEEMHQRPALNLPLKGLYRNRAGRRAEAW